MRPIPVSVVTGFLGSGKTTLIGRILRDPGFARTAVVVNEFGEIGLDHELIARGDDTVVALSSGCLCCVVQSDLARTLMGLLGRREAYDRVLIETSGLSDPVPLLQAMMIDGGVAATHRLASVVTVVDTVHGGRTLDEHAEARQQVALADRIVLSKTDLCEAGAALLARLERLNPGAPRMTGLAGDPGVLFDGGNVAGLADRLAGMMERPGHGEVETFTVVRERPLPALALTLLLQALAEHCGGRLLRFKGLVSIREMPGRPAVIHGVRHVVSSPEFLDCWPSGDERTRMVFIGRGVPRYFVSRLLDAIEEEVQEATGH